MGELSLCPEKRVLQPNRAKISPIQQPIVSPSLQTRASTRNEQHCQTRLSNVYRRLLSEQYSYRPFVAKHQLQLAAQIDLPINCPCLASSPPNSRRHSLRIANESVHQVFLCVCGLVLLFHLLAIPCLAQRLQRKRSIPFLIEANIIIN